MLRSKLQYLFIVLSILCGQYYWLSQIHYTETSNYTSHCLTLSAPQKPVGECYELPTSGSANRIITIQHQATSATHKAVTFIDQNQTKFRFTPDKMGTWNFKEKQQIVINQPRPNYAKGFIVAKDNKWVRSATMKPFSPQYLMAELAHLSEAELDDKIDQLIIKQGFTGFHIANLRDFLTHPHFFEALILKTYRAGGATHFWIWGDAQRNQTPDSYGVDVEQLYQSITARLAPLPGWSVGFGFDLYEWAKQADIELWQQQLSRSSYHHLLGARGNKNSYNNKIQHTDYCSYEWHKPQLVDYISYQQRCPNQPAFSEDRFRIRQNSRYPEKDYTEEEIINGLWNAFIAGGIANIWGKQHRGTYSAPFKYQDAIKTYQLVTEHFFQIDMQYKANIISNGECLAGQKRIICYLPSTKKVLFTKSKYYRQWRWIKIPAFKPYLERVLKSADLFQTMDWIIVGFNTQQ